MRIPISKACSALAVLLLAASANAATFVVTAKTTGQKLDNIAASVQAAGGKVTAALPEIGILVADSAAPGFASAVLRNSAVQNVTEDFPVAWIGDVRTSIATKVRASSVDVEPLAAQQWNMYQIHADQTAAAGFRGNNAVRARVAVLDEGVLCQHEDIAPNLNNNLSASFVPGEAVCATTTEFNHGTHVAGIIAAPINGKGIQGVAPEAEIVAVKVMSEKNGSGLFSWIIAGIVYAASAPVHADVINMSLGATFDRINAGGGGAGSLIAALNRAVDYATSQGALVVSATGNEGVDLNSRLWSVPAQSGNGMAVSATGPVGGQNFERLASYSNYGQSVVSVAAPGGDAMLAPSLTPYPWYLDMVLSAGAYDKKNGSQYFYADGTSMAAPHVSGIAALIIGKYGRMSPSQVRTMIEQSAVDILKPGADAATGHGRADAAAALNLQY